MSGLSCAKSFWDYEAYIFDLDGTLYFQKQLRLIMATRLAGYYLCHPLKIKELLIVKSFRDVKEKWGEISKDIATDAPVGDELSLDNAQYSYVARRMNVAPEVVAKVIRKWIYENPLDAVAKSKDEALINIITDIREKGKKVIIFSDYPTNDKLKALGVKADGEYCSEDAIIGELKPSPKGIEVIINDFSLTKENVLMIGDRMEKDGESAKGAGIDYLILPRSKSKRRYDFN